VCPTSEVGSSRPRTNELLSRPLRLGKAVTEGPPDPPPDGPSSFFARAWDPLPAHQLLRALVAVQAPPRTDNQDGFLLAASDVDDLESWPRRIRSPGFQSGPLRRMLSSRTPYSPTSLNVRIGERVLRSAGVRLRRLSAIVEFRRLWAATLLLAALFVAPTANASKTTVVKPNTLVHLQGTDTYCTVLRSRSIGVSVACFHDPGGPSSAVRKGWAIAAADKLVAVEPAGSTTPVKVTKEPSFAKVPPFMGGSAINGLVLHLHELAEVAGTHMGIAAEPAQGGGAGLVIADIDGKGKFIVGSYGAAIGDHFVAITKASPSQQLLVVYQHPVYDK
jgi:hypothetical protein